MAPGAGLLIQIHSTPKSVIIRNLPSAYDHNEILEHVKLDYPSASTILDLRKPGSQARFRSVKMVLNDPTDFSNLLSHGLRIGWEHFRAEEWLPPPIQCYRCQRFGHRSNTCQTQHRCIKCSECHEPTKNCQKETKCANCKGVHMANSRDCPARQRAMMEQKALLATSHN